MTYDAFWNEVNDTFVKHKGKVCNIRLGQTFVNLLHKHRPDILRFIQQEQCDPFYNNDLIPKADEIARQNWGGDF